MRQSVISFFVRNAFRNEIENKRVLEIGSRDVNGSVKPFIQTFRPKEYVGIDLAAGPRVNVVLPAEQAVKYFGAESFDVVISTETLEHVEDWRSVITNIKEVLMPSGYVFITTVCQGYPLHDYPADCWRYEVEDMEKIFRDFNILVLREEDDYAVFLKAQKPENWKPRNLKNIKLFNMETQKQV